MPLEEYKRQFVSSMLELVWEQWAHLGVFSDVKTAGLSIIDPEALLLFTLQIGRFDARLYDEILSWLVENEQMINIQRLKNIMKSDENVDKTLISAAVSVPAASGGGARWKNISVNKNKDKTPLFLSQDFSELTVWGENDANYIRYGWIRPKLALRKLSCKIDIFRVSNLLIRLRYLLGINLRAELVAYLLTHESGNPTEISKKIYYSQPTVQQACGEIEKSGMAVMTPCGKEIKIALDRKKWAEFLKIKGISKIKWVNWPLIFKAFNAILKFLASKDWKGVSEYIQNSESARLVKTIWSYLSKNNPGLLFDANISLNDEELLKKFVDVILKSL